MEDRVPTDQQLSSQAGNISLKSGLDHARSICAHGTEAQLKQELGFMISKVEELSALVQSLQQAQVEMETALTLAKSNLALAVANNEMLEDALKRESGGLGKDVGWRRWSEREGHLKRQIASQSHLHATTENPTKMSIRPSQVQDGEAEVPALHQESTRFFRFKFGSGTIPNFNSNSSPSVAVSSDNQSATQSLPRTGTPSSKSSRQGTPHLTSPSLPLLTASSELPEISLESAQVMAMKGEIESLRKNNSSIEANLKQCQAEKTILVTAKVQLEEELESLSQALFEAANKMVAEERKKRAAYQEELEMVKAEKEALKGALQVVEGERNGLLLNGQRVEN